MNTYPTRACALSIVVIAVLLHLPGALAAAPTSSLGARAETEATDVRLTARAKARSARASGKASIPVATVTWARPEPASTFVDSAGSVVWRNKGAVGVGVAGYVVATQPGETLDGISTLIHGPAASTQPPPSGGTSNFGSAPATATMLGWLLQGFGPFLLVFVLGAAAVPILRFIFRPRTR